MKLEAFNLITFLLAKITTPHVNTPTKNPLPTRAPRDT